MSDYTKARKGAKKLRKTPVRKISDKKKAQLIEYRKLINWLRNLCNNRSELSGNNPDWKSNYLVDPHHICGRVGALCLDPFNIVMVTRDEHTSIQENRGLYTKAYLLARVRTIRLKQGY